MGLETGLGRWEYVAYWAIAHVCDLLESIGPKLLCAILARLFVLEKEDKDRVSNAWLSLFHAATAKLMTAPMAVRLL